MMRSHIYLELLFIIVLLFFSGFFSASETAFFSLSKVRLRRKKFRARKEFEYVVRLLQSPSKFLATVLIGNEIVNISISVVTAALMYVLLKDVVPPTVLPFCAMAVTVPVLLLFGEIIPKTIAVKFPEQIARFNSRILYVFYTLISPVRFVLNAAAKILMRPFVKDPTKQPVDAITIDEEIFKSMVDIGKKEGTIEADERDLIHRAFRLDDISLSQIMTPLENIVAIPLDIDEESLKETILIQKYSRYPVYKNSPREIVGFVHAKDLLRLRDGRQHATQFTLRSILRKPIFVPSDRNALFVLLQFQKIKSHIGIVLDSQGKTAGIVTLEDILEELFGEITDETDMEDRTGD